MISCPNINSPEWKALVASVGETEAYYQWYKADGNPIIPKNQVQYALKAVDILLSDKAKQVFVKGEKNNWDINKILTELAIPKEQKQLILDSGKTNREEIITDFLANYSYTIEINTAKDSNKLVDWENNPNTTYFEFTVDDIKYTDSTYGYYYKRLPNTPKDVEISEEEYNKAKIKSSKNLEAKPTQYYSNLTVPGGTNGSYIEANIETPMIVPSIQSHAQFKTDNTIGWMRADEKQNYQEKDIDNLIEIMKKSGILEVNCG